MEELMTPKDVARRLKISLRKAYALKYQIGYIKLGGNIRLEASAVEAYIDRCRQEPVTPMRPADKWSSGPCPAPGYPRRVTADDVRQLLKEKQNAKKTR